MIALVLLGVLLLAACTQVEPEPGDALEPTAGPTTDPGGAGETPEADAEVDAAAEAARKALALREDIEVDEVEVVSREPMEWSDSCLGLGGPAESCLQAITPGWLMTLRVPGVDDVVEVRTDQTGEVVRIADTATQEPGLPNAAVRAIEELAAELGIAMETIEVVSFSQQEWSDSCLGLGGPAESCAQAITPGWLVILRAPGDGVAYEVRTDETGDVVRFQQSANPDIPLPGPAARAREQLAVDLGLGPELVAVLNYEQVDWPDSCLGLAGPDEMCMQVITPGWLVLLAANGQTYEAHTDNTGDVVRFGPPTRQRAPGSGESGPPAIIFQRTGGIAGEEVSFTVYPSGMMEILTGRGGPDQPVETVQVDPLAVETLLAGLKEAGFFDLATDTTPVVPCCDRFVYFLTVTDGAQTNSISVVESEDGLAEAALLSVKLVQEFIEAAGQSSSR
jgi:hypothetical protein